MSDIVDESEPMMPVKVAKILDMQTDDSGEYRPYSGTKPQMIYGWIKQGYLKPVNGNMVTIAAVKQCVDEAAERRSQRAGGTKKERKQAAGGEALKVDLKGAGIGSLISYASGVMVRPLLHLKWETNLLVHASDVDDREVVWNKEKLNVAIKKGDVVVENPLHLLLLLSRVLEDSWEGTGKDLEEWILNHAERFKEPSESSVVGTFPIDVQEIVHQQRQARQNPQKPSLLGPALENHDNE